MWISDSTNCKVVGKGLTFDEKECIIVLNLEKKRVL